MKAFRNHDIYKVQAIAGLGSPARNTDVRSPTGVDTAARAYLARYEVDRRSIFVGNLPAGTTEDQIRSLFEQYGSIEDIIIRETVSKFECKSRSTSLIRSRTDNLSSSREVLLCICRIQNRNFSWQCHHCQGNGSSPFSKGHF